MGRVLRFRFGPGDSSVRTPGGIRASGVITTVEEDSWGGGGGV